jgi:threonine/homoserine/homoserine lactone efflux protein
MIDVNAIVGVTGIFALGVMSPGPNFLVVAQRAVTRGRADALATMLGVVTISMVWASSSLFGISVVFKLFPWTRLALKLLGAAYLVWFGVRLWRHARDPIAAAPAGLATRAGFWPAFRAGLATNLANAKAIAFYSSVFAAAAPPPGETATLWLALALVMLISLGWYSLVAFALSTGAIARAYRSAKQTIERTCGVLMVLFGAHLATAA